MLGGTSYIPLPEYIISCHAINNDQKYLQYAVLLRFVNSDHSQRLAHHYDKLAGKFNLSDLKFPILLEDVKIFEKTNRGVTVKVNGIIKGKNTNKNKFKNSKSDVKIQSIVVLSKVCNEELENHFDLLLVDDGDCNKHSC